MVCVWLLEILYQLVYPMLMRSTPEINSCYSIPLRTVAVGAAAASRLPRLEKEQLSEQLASGCDLGEIGSYAKIEYGVGTLAFNLVLPENEKGCGAQRRRSL
jgi:hypothetical protein